MIRLLKFLFLGVFAISLTSQADAQVRRGDRWKLLDVEDVDLSKGQASINLAKARGSYKGFRIRATRASIRLKNIQFVYSDGTSFDRDKPIQLNTGERTVPLDLRLEERFVERLNIVYDVVEEARRDSKLQIYGLQSRRGRRAKRPAEDPVVAGPTAPIPTPEKIKPEDLKPEGDVLFGKHYVGLGLEQDIIRVDRKLGKFSSIRLLVRDHDLYVNDLKVVYDGGGEETLTVASDIAKGTRTDWLTVNGEKFIKEIHVAFRSDPDSKKQARVEVLGKHSEAWLGPDGEGKKFNDGWVLLGARSAGFIGFDKDVIPVGDTRGGFKKLRVAVHDRSITLSQLRVVYLDGQEDIIPVKSRVGAGSTYGPIDLQRPDQQIREIRARYRSRFIDSAAAGKGNAIVEIWAKH